MRKNLGEQVTAPSFGLGNNRHWWCCRHTTRGLVSSSPTWRPSSSTTQRGTAGRRALLPYPLADLCQTPQACCADPRCRSPDDCEPVRRPDTRGVPGHTVGPAAHHWRRVQVGVSELDLATGWPLVAKEPALRPANRPSALLCAAGHGQAAPSSTTIALLPTVWTGSRPALSPPSRTRRAAGLAGLSAPQVSAIVQQECSYFAMPPACEAPLLSNSCWCCRSQGVLAMIVFLPSPSLACSAQVTNSSGVVLGKPLAQTR